jgi:hypothetical protein
MKEDIITKKLEFLQETINRCFKDPAITLKQLAEILAFELPDIKEFLKVYQKEIKKEEETNEK